MHRLLLAAIGTACLAVLAVFVGCSRPHEGPRGAADIPTTNTPGDAPAPNAVRVGDTANRVYGDFINADLISRAAPQSPQERYDAALRDAVDQVIDQHYDKAMAALKAAQQIQDTELVRNEIAKIDDLLRQRSAAEQTARDVQTVLDDGRADDASRLGIDALQQFGGGGDFADNLSQQKRQADTLVAASLSSDDERFNRFKTEGDMARSTANFRAAALSYEQALRFREDPTVRATYDDTVARLSRYDDDLHRAATLRRDPAGLEDAIAALNDAQAVWDTPQVRQQIDEFTFALQQRRDRVSIAEFEVRGDIGVPGAGKTVAETLLPCFRPRFDLVEREQVGRILGELKLEAADLAGSPDGQRQVGQLAKVRYLVLGSVTPLNGITVNARLVNVQTGVIEQTARICAPSAAELEPRLKLLAQMLQMNDDQKLAFEQMLGDKAAEQPVQAIQAIDLTNPSLPPLLDIVVGVPPPPIIVTYAPPPSPKFFFNISFGDFRGFAAAPVVAAPPPSLDVVLAANDPRRGRMFALSVELGDNLFRRGQYAEAHRQFSLALSLSGGNADIALRIGKCKPFLPTPPPPAVVVVAPPPVRPRLIVFSFLLGTPPGLVPANLGDVAADQFAAYFGPSFEIVDRGEVCWYMGRLGITFRDVVNDPGARVALAQAMNVRFYCFGTVAPTASLDVQAQLVDAMSGTATATARIHVQDHLELKLRLNELAIQLSAPGDKGRLCAQQGAASEKALNDARALLKAGQPAQAAVVARQGLEIAPQSAALRTVLAQAEGEIEHAKIEQQRKAAEAAHAQAMREAEARQKQLAQQAAAARLQAEKTAKERTADAKQVEERKKVAAAQQLEAEGKKAFAAGNYPKAVGDFKSAAALHPSPELNTELAEAQRKQKEAGDIKVAAATQAKAVADQRAKVDAQAKIALEKQRLAEENKSRQEARSKEAAGLLAQARQDFAEKQYAKAQAAAQSAQQINRTAEGDQLLAQIQQQLAATTRTEDTRKAEEVRLANEKAQKLAAAKKALDTGKSALAAKNYPVAVSSLTEASNLDPTNAEARSLLQQAVAARDAQAAGQNKAAQHAALLQQANAALAAKKYDDTAHLLAQADALVPGDPQARALAAELQRARDQSVSTDRNAAQYGEELKAANAALVTKQYDNAIAHAAAALRLKANDPAATALIKEAQSGKASGDAEKKKQADYAAAIQAARAALAAKNYDVAIKSANDAQRLFPGDRTAADLANQAQAAKNAGEAAAMRKAQYDRQMAAGAAAMQGKRFKDAIIAYNEALHQVPGDPAATKGLNDARIADTPKPPPPPPPAPAAPDYNKLMQTGQTFEQQKKWAEASAAYQQALKAKPGDAKATYGVDMAEGQRALDAKRWTDAQKWFEDALRHVPSDPSATALLKRAKEMR